MKRTASSLLLGFFILTITPSFAQQFQGPGPGAGLGGPGLGGPGLGGPGAGLAGPATVGAGAGAAGTAGAGGPAAGIGAAPAAGAGFGGPASGFGPVVGGNLGGFNNPGSVFSGFGTVGNNSGGFGGFGGFGTPGAPPLAGMQSITPGAAQQRVDATMMSSCPIIYNMMNQDTSGSLAPRADSHRAGRYGISDLMPERGAAANGRIGSPLDAGLSLFKVNTDGQEVMSSILVTSLLNRDKTNQKVSMQDFHFLKDSPPANQRTDHQDFHLLKGSSNQRCDHQDFHVTKAKVNVSDFHFVGNRDQERRPGGWSGQSDLEFTPGIVIDGEEDPDLGAAKCNMSDFNFTWRKTPEARRPGMPKNPYEVELGPTAVEYAVRTKE